MHVPDDVKHDRVKFRTETTLYAPYAKMTNRTNWKLFKKNPKKIMHVPDDLTHDRVKFRTETTSYATCAKMTKFLWKVEKNNART